MNIKFCTISRLIVEKNYRITFAPKNLLQKDQLSAKYGHTKAGVHNFNVSIFVDNFEGVKESDYLRGMICQNEANKEDVLTDNYNFLKLFLH